MGRCILKEWFRWKRHALLVFTAAEHLALNGVPIYNEAWVHHHADLGAAGVLLIGSHLLHEAGVEVRGRGSTEDGNGILVGEGEVVQEPHRFEGVEERGQEAEGGLLVGDLGELGQDEFHADDEEAVEGGIDDGGS